MLLEKLLSLYIQFMSVHISILALGRFISGASDLIGIELACQE